MLVLALNFLLGIVLFSHKELLAISTGEYWVLSTVFFLAVILFNWQKTLSINLLAILLGFIWMAFISNQSFNHSVPQAAIEKPTLIKGVIIDLPESSQQKTKFNFQAQSPFQAKLKLSWYGNQRPELIPGDQWELLLKLKNNNGYQNLGGFDYEKWLFYKQFNATGYVKKSSKNRILSTNQGFDFDRLRYQLRQSLLELLKTYELGGVINALIIGDRSLIQQNHWQLFTATNTTHLSVISGLHIGLVSGFVFLLVQFLWRRSTRLCLWVPAQVASAYAGLLIALAYALLAGFSIPTQRAFIMAGVVFASIIFRRHHNVWHLYAIALILVLIHNPLGIFSVGFWLSFYVVAIIIYGAKQHKNKSWLYRIIYIQLLISLATIPLIAWFFSAGSTLSPIANLIAIPIFSFIATPLSLIGALLFVSGLDEFSQLAFVIADQSLLYLSYFLSYLQGFNFNQWYFSQSSLIGLITLLAIFLLAISPKGLKLRWLFIPMLLSVIISPKQASLNKHEALITTLDVGQGLAIVVQTQNHVLLFDTGAAYASGFNLAQSVIIPYLHAQHIYYLDKVIVSHGDNDHIGGLDHLLDHFKVGEITSSVPEQIKRTSQHCQSGQSWQWDGVVFEVLNPDKQSNFSGNNTSCVLKISTKNFSALLTADIEKQAEKQLIKNHSDQLNVDVMLAPHHGSKTSSTQAFLEAASPSTIIISSGYKNRFNHPHKTVIKRYKTHDINFINTSCSGQVDVKLGEQIDIQQYRKQHARYYLRQC